MRPDIFIFMLAQLNRDSQASVKPLACAQIKMTDVTTYNIPNLVENEPPASLTRMCTRVHAGVRTFDWAKGLRARLVTCVRACVRARNRFSSPR